jgi:hypothetical protein
MIELSDSGRSDLEGSSWRPIPLRTPFPRSIRPHLNIEDPIPKELRGERGSACALML